MSRPRLREPEYRLRQRGRFWVLSWTDPDSRATRAVSTRQTDRGKAEIWRDQFLAGRAQPEPPKRPLISAILDGYLAARKPHVAAYATLQYDAKALNRHVGNLEPHMLGRRVYRQARERESVSDGTIRREIGTLRAALAWAKHERWIETVPNIESPPKPPPRERWLTREEFERLLAACARAGLEDCSPHVLRHTAATHMVMARVPLAEIARLLGDSEAMVERTYGKHSPDYLRGAVDALAGDLSPRLVSETLSEK